VLSGQLSHRFRKLASSLRSHLPPTLLRSLPATLPLPPNAPSTLQFDYHKPNPWLTLRRRSIWTRSLTGCWKVRPSAPFFFCFYFCAWRFPCYLFRSVIAPPLLPASASLACHLCFVLASQSVQGGVAGATVGARLIPVL
jgi:hypothetical protein